ncbi:MAG TPA: lycopene cyclase domain-containing protein, partial [Ktedonobacterales bacterium]
MTYMWFLILFLLLPIAGLTPLLLRDRLRKQSRVQHARAWLPLTLLLALLVVAVVYTTPWDHHLIATGVWWYAPDRLLGATIGRIPLEEML